MSDFLNRIHHADCIELMRQLPDNSVDFICTDPPYYTTQLGFDKGKRIDWQAWWVEANRVLKPAGVVCLFASSVATFELYATNPKRWRYTLIWEKTRYSRFLDANHRPLQAHEDILVFCRQPKKAVYNPQKVHRPEIQKRGPRIRHDNGTDHYAASGGNVYEDDGFRHPGTVLKFGSGCNAQVINKTQKPVELIRWLIRAYSNAGDVVLDTCSGSGTCGAACLIENRQFILCDNDVNQVQASEKRLDEYALRLQLPLFSCGMIGNNKLSFPDDSLSLVNQTGEKE